MDSDFDCLFCVNCGSASGCIMLQDEQILHCIQEWTAPRLVQADDFVCTVCFSEAKTATYLPSSDRIGQKCALCKVILPRRAHQVIALRTDTLQHVNIKNIILERLHPVEVRASHYICHPCWQRADRAAKHYSSASTSRADSVHILKCVNCNIDITRMRRHILNDDSLLTLIQQRVAPQLVTAADYICDACHILFNNNETSIINSQTRTVGHQNVCIQCGHSVTHSRYITVQAEQNQHIRNIVQDWIQPREIQPSDVICHTCYRRAEGVHAASMVNPVPQQIATIHLPNYLRAPDTHSRCIFPSCNSSLQHVVPYALRVRLFRDHKYYIPPNSRICESHLGSQRWSILFEAENVQHCFTAGHIEEFCELLKNDKTRLDFEKIDDIEDNVVWYWLGRTKVQFREVEAVLPEFPRRATALAAYLIKLRTGDSDDRISTLMNISRSTLSKLINKARNSMVEYFVPLHLGLQHMNRMEVAERNLYIPNSLFGNPGSIMNDRKAIAIMDGTYVYVQKSSNYKYQKKTYSLHKYRNLVKPFLIVCCDGHILDVLGPYPATKSDADIIKHEFSNESFPLREYFREGDIFLLDRGFRDSIPLLQNLNYSVHYPLSVEQGETQMSTINANESRKVTLCRWVVEVVNGRFKRDFKLLRQEYCNKYSKNLMHDFEVAAALINRFHPVLVDREDAREIVSVIQERIFEENYLADFVELHNLNRKRAQYRSITVEINNIDFPRMEYEDLILISLGIYQIKQARSYYGEHIRQDGSYIIEVCREVDDELLSNLNIINNENTWLLRGKIASRHISSKKYYIYILIDATLNGRYAIKNYCCNCIVGRRTIGCCAHIMTLIWYLSWARYQTSIIDPPAQFLDDILIDDVDDAPDHN